MVGTVKNILTNLAMVDKTLSFFEDILTSDIF
jgi:hypothetical protein